MPGLFLLLSSVTFAAETWLGGNAMVGGGYVDGGLTAPTTAEAAFRARTDWLYVQVDLEVWADLAVPGLIQPYPPEWAVLQVGREEGPFGRVGVQTPMMGIEDYEPYLNYLPIFSNHWNAIEPGRFLGVAGGQRLADGTELVAWGGRDMDYGWVEGAVLPETVWTAGLGVSGEWDMASTWSGVFAYPEDGLYGGFLSGEVYPHELLTVAADLSAGGAEGSAYVGGQLVLVGFPEAGVNPAVRVEYNHDPDEVLGNYADDGIYRASASAGVKAYLGDWVVVAGEGQVRWAEGRAWPGAFVMASVLRHEPGWYQVSE